MVNIKQQDRIGGVNRRAKQFDCSGGGEGEEAVLLASTVSFEKSMNWWMASD